MWTRSGFDHYLDQMISENESALQAAEGGQQPTDAVLRRTAVRKRIAERYAEFITLRQQLTNSDRQTHYEVPNSARRRKDNDHGHRPPIHPTCTTNAPPSQNRRLSYPASALVIAYSYYV